MTSPWTYSGAYSVGLKGWLKRRWPVEVYANEDLCQPVMVSMKSEAWIRGVTDLVV